jgi:hypothetical protein
MLAPRESFLHLFFECPETSSTLEAFERKYLLDFDFNSEADRKKFFFLGMASKNNKKIDPILTGTISAVIMFYIWECKLLKNFQSFASCDLFFKYHMDNMRRISENFNKFVTNSELLVTRYRRDG